MLGDCHCSEGLGRGFMPGMDWVSFIENDPDPGSAYDDGSLYFTQGTEGLGFSLPDIGGGGDFGGGGGLTLPSGFPAYDPNAPIYVCPDGSFSPVPCEGGDTGPSPLPPAPSSTGGGTSPGGGGPGINWGSIISNLINTAGGVARQAVGGQQYPGGQRVVGYTPTGQPILGGGVSGGVSLGPGGITGSAGISTNTLIIAGLVGLAFILGGKR